MNYDVNIIKKEDYKVSNWSGGKTTELFIYPKNACYADRNFDWRISAATVEDEKSIFTNLPGIKRQIIITEGKTILEHKEQYKITLNPFEKDIFMGEWETISYGKASDFNLMTSKACSGNLEVVYFNMENKISIEMNKSGAKVFELFYAVGGNVRYLLECGEYCVNEKDMFCINYLSDEKYGNMEIYKENSNDIKIIRTTVIY